MRLEIKNVHVISHTLFLFIMYNVNTIKKNILDRLNAQIKEARDSRDSHMEQIPFPKSSKSVSKDSKSNKDTSDGSRKEELKSNFHSIMEDQPSKSTRSSRNSLDNVDMSKIKSSGKIRELLAQHRMENEKQVQKPPWMGRNGPSQSHSNSAYSSKHSLANSLLAGAVKLPPLSSSKGSIQSKPNNSEDVFSRLYRPKSVKSIKSVRSSPTFSEHSFSTTISRPKINQNKPLPSLQKKKSPSKRPPSSSFASTSDHTTHLSDQETQDDEEEETEESEESEDESISTSKPTSETPSIASKASKPDTSYNLSKEPKQKWSLFGSNKSTKNSNNQSLKDPKITSLNSKSTTPSDLTSKVPLKPTQSVKKENEFTEIEIPTDEITNVNTKRCKNCSRPFAIDRLEKHETICKKMTKSHKERGNFDSKEMRIKGTELDQYKKTNRAKSAPKESVNKPASSNWRKTHEEFVKSMREAKKLQAHLAKGGKLSDLPPMTTPSKNDGKPCPHCSRKFSENAYERHTSICKNLRHKKGSFY